MKRLHLMMCALLVISIAFPVSADVCDPPDCTVSYPYCWYSADPGFDYSCGWNYSGADTVFNYLCAQFGTTSARFSSPGDTIYQDVEIPSTVYELFVDWRFKIVTADRYGAIIISIQDPSTGNELEHVTVLNTLQDDDDCGGLNGVELEGDYAGETIRLHATMIWGPSGSGDVVILLDGFGISGRHN